MKKYFVCHRFRCFLDEEYIKKFYENKEYKKLYDNRKSAETELKNGFYDDSDYSVILLESGVFKILR